MSDCDKYMKSVPVFFLSVSCLLLQNLNRFQNILCNKLIAWLHLSETLGSHNSRSKPCLSWDLYRTAWLLLSSYWHNTLLWRATWVRTSRCNQFKFPKTILVHPSQIFCLLWFFGYWHICLLVRTHFQVFQLCSCLTYHSQQDLVSAETKGGSERVRTALLLLGKVFCHNMPLSLI